MNARRLGPPVGAPPVWSPAWALPFESAFNWLQKYAWANLANGQVFLRDLLGRKSIQRTSAPFDLLVGEWSTTRNLNLPNGLNLPDGFVSHFGKRWPERFARGDNFRFCPTCLRNGYHSIFYQFDAISCCPIHGDALRIRCSHCHTATPALALGYESFERPFRCTGCHRTLADSFDPRRWLETSIIREGIQRALRPIAEWLQTLERDVGGGMPDDDCLLFSGGGRAPPLEPLRLLSDEPRDSTAAAWFEMAAKIVPCPLSTDFLALPNRPILLRRIYLRRLPESARPFKGHAEADCKRSIVKSVRRYLLRTHLRGHERCIREAFREVTVERFVYEQELHQSPGLCPLAVTYVRWVHLNRGRALIGQRYGGGGQKTLDKLAELARRSTVDPDRVLFGHSVLAEFFACAAPVIAFDWHWYQVASGRIGRSTMNERLAEHCVIADGMIGAWACELAIADDKRRHLLLASPQSEILNRLVHTEPPNTQARMPSQRRVTVPRSAPVPSKGPTHRELWNSKWANPYESAWSLVQKYAIANSCKEKELNQWISEALPYAARTADLLFGRGLRRPFPVIAPGVAIRQGTLLAYGQRWRCRLTIERNHLRFCRECLSYGYHSALHQILEMETCAVHRMPLLTRCPACDQATMGCHLSDSWIAAECNCRRCHLPLGSKSATDNWELPAELHARIERAFGRLAQWIRLCERTDLNDQRFRRQLPQGLQYRSLFQLAVG